MMDSWCIMPMLLIPSAWCTRTALKARHPRALAVTEEAASPRLDLPSSGWESVASYPLLSGMDRMTGRGSLSLDGWGKDLVEPTLATQGQGQVRPFLQLTEGLS